MIIGQVTKKPRYSPWLGATYGQDVLQKKGDFRFSSPLPKVHVMGESHYSSDYADDAILTQSVVRDWAFERSAGSHFFSRVAAIWANTPPSEVDLGRVWNAIAYSNFVQTMLPGPRIAPSKEMWADARSSFFGQLDATRPQVLLVLGKRLWQQLPWEEGGLSPDLHQSVDGTRVEDAWLYPWIASDHTEQLTVAVNVVHPSGRGFDWRLAAERLNITISYWSNLSIICDELFKNHSLSSGK